MTFSRREKELGKVRENRQSMKSLWTIISNFDFQLSDVKRSKHSEEDNEEIIVDVGNTDSSSEHESFYPPTTTHSEAPEHHESSEHEAEKKDEDLTVYVGGKRKVIYSCHICDCFFLKEVKVLSIFRIS